MSAEWTRPAGAPAHGGRPGDGGSPVVTAQDLEIALETVKRLMDLVGRSRVTAVRVGFEPLCVEVGRGEAPGTRPAGPSTGADAGTADIATDDAATDEAATADAATAGGSTPGAGTKPSAEAGGRKGGGVVVTAPLVGVFYRGPAPGRPPFVQVGDEVETGGQLGIIEAMKVMNPILAESPGVITAVHAQDAEVVEFEQPLVSIDPLPGPAAA